MSYCFACLREREDGCREPDFPEGTSYIQLAGSWAMDYALYRYSLESEHSHWKPKQPAGRDLRALIASGRNYPPALALAREEMSRRFKKRSPEVAEFSAAMCAELRRHLAGQATSGFVLVPSRVQEIGYLEEGEWQWVLGRSRKNREHVYWVSDDYCVYTNAISDFALTDAQLANLRDFSWH